MAPISRWVRWFRSTKRRVRKSIAFLWYTARPMMASGTIPLLRWMVDVAELVSVFSVICYGGYCAWQDVFCGKSYILNALPTIQRNWIAVLIVSGVMILGSINKFAQKLKRIAGVESGDDQATAEKDAPRPMLNSGEQ